VVTAKGLIFCSLANAGISGGRLSAQGVALRGRYFCDSILKFDNNSVNFVTKACASLLLCQPLNGLGEAISAVNE
jgi:hypothetical protein